MSAAQTLACMAIVMTSSTTTCACVMPSTREGIVKLKWTPATRTTVRTGLFVNLCIILLHTSATAMGLVSKVIFYYKIHDLSFNSFLASGDFCLLLGAQWLCDRVLDSRKRGHGFEPYQRHGIVSLSKTH